MARHVDDLLTAYVHGELHGELLERVEQHLKICSECREELERERSVHQVLCSAKALKARPELWRDVDKQLAIERDKRLPRFAWALAAGVVAAFAFFFLVQRRPEEPALAVLDTKGLVTVSDEMVGAGAKVKRGQMLCTADGANTRIAVGDIGEVEVSPRSEVELIESGPNQHRMRLHRGSISAKVTAPPRLFIIETPSVEAVDLGCSYTLEVDGRGDTHLKVTTGWVALEREGPDGIVPAGWSCATTRGKVGTPIRDEAPPSIKKAFREFDLAPGVKSLKGVLGCATREDALGVWHLLSRTTGVEREKVFDRLSKLVPLPRDCQKEAVLNLEQGALERWRVAISWYGVKEVILPFGLGVIPNPNGE